MNRIFLPIVLLCSIQCTTVTVYVCSSNSSVKYHYKENCRGLSTCQYRIVKTTLDAALKTNKTLCNWEKQGADTSGARKTTGQ